MYISVYTYIHVQCSVWVLGFYTPTWGTYAACMPAYGMWKVACVMHISKKRLRERVRKIFHRAWSSQTCSSAYASCLRLKINKCLGEELTPPTLHCKTHAISFRNISCSSLFSRFHDLKKNGAHMCTYDYICIYIYTYEPPSTSIVYTWYKHVCLNQH